MKTKEIIEIAQALSKPFRISKGKEFRIKDFDPSDTLECTEDADKAKAQQALASEVMAEVHGQP